MRNTRHYHPHLLRKIIVFCTVILIGYSNSVLALDAEQQEFVKEQLESFERTISSNSEFFESQKTKNDYYAAIEDILQQKVDLYIWIIAWLPAPWETWNTEQSEPEDFVQEQIANYRRIVNYYPVIFKTQQDIDIYYAEIQKILKNKIDVYNWIIAWLPEPWVIATPVLCRSSTPTYGECQWGSSVLVDEIRSPAGCVWGVQSPAFKSCNNVACNYTYSYSACRPNNTKRATVTEVSPAGCVWTPIIQVWCSYTQPTGPSTCVYTYTDYWPCQSGQRTRSIIGTSPLWCSGALPQPLSQSCSSNSPFSGIVTRKLNDTGVDQCADDNNMSTALCAIYTNDSNEYPQDANIWRDAEVRDGLLSKRWAGRKGFVIIAAIRFTFSGRIIP